MVKKMLIRKKQISTISNGLCIGEANALRMQNSIVLYGRLQIENTISEFCMVLPLSPGKASVNMISGTENPITGSAGESSFVMNYRVDALGAHGVLRGWDYQDHPPFDDKPTQGTFDWGKLVGNIIAGLVMVAYVALAVASLGTSVMVTAFVVGSLAVCAYAAWDAKDGNVGESIEYMYTGLIAAVTAATAAHLAPYAAKFIANLFGVSTYPMALKYFIEGTSGSFMNNWLNNYENDSIEEMTMWALFSGVLNMALSPKVDKIEDAINGSLNYADDVAKYSDDIANTSLKRMLNKFSKAKLSLKEIKLLYGVSNPNDLARAIKANPKLLARQLAASTVDNEYIIADIIKNIVGDQVDSAATDTAKNIVDPLVNAWSDKLEKSSEQELVDLLNSLQ